mmetsp:Transcript_30083/g.68081  ORF Transcript_30083/g.68081 Transcript_30083/m.68081 type:complete len:203 (-) Transcript_30083:478-1086(-)
MDCGVVSCGGVSLLRLCCVGGMEWIRQRDLRSARGPSQPSLELPNPVVRREPQHVLDWGCLQRPSRVARRLRLRRGGAGREDVSDGCQDCGCDQAGGDSDVSGLRLLLHSRRELRSLHSRKQGGRHDRLRPLWMVGGSEGVEHSLLLLRRLRRHHNSRLRGERPQQRPPQQHLPQLGHLDVALHAGRLGHVRPHLLHVPGCR